MIPIPSADDIRQAKELVDAALDLVPVEVLRDYLEASGVERAEARFEAEKRAKFGSKT